MNWLFLVAEELKRLADNSQVWPRAQLQSRLFKLHAAVTKAIVRLEKKS